MGERQVWVCQYTNCTRNGSAEVLEAFRAADPIAGVTIQTTSCLGQCSVGPTVRVTPDEIWYCRVKPGDVPSIVEQHLEGNEPVRSLLHPRFHPDLRVVES
jgi:(2Fe-2S) ferredoxin